MGSAYKTRAIASYTSRAVSGCKTLAVNERRIRVSLVCRCMHMSRVAVVRNPRTRDRAEAGNVQVHDQEAAGSAQTHVVAASAPGMVALPVAAWLRILVVLAGADMGL